MPYGLTLVTAPTLTPVNVAEAKAQAEYEDTDRDTWFDRAIRGAARLVEAYTGRSLLTQTWRLTLAGFPGGRWPATSLALPRAAPLQSVSSVTYYDDEVSTTLDTATYGVLTDREPGEVYLVDGETWPDADTRPDAVTITYVAGWTAASLVPEEIKQAVLMTVADWFANRERAEELPGAVKTLLSLADLALYV